MSNNIFIDLTEELANKGWTVHWEFNGGDIDPLLKYNNCVTYLDCREIEPDVATDVDENGAWNYCLDNLETSGVSDMESFTFDGLFLIDEGVNNNTSLVSFNVDLPNLTDGSMMFASCTNLTSFSSDLPNLTDGSMMFAGCKNLTSFSSDLLNLTDGQGMFSNCMRLTSFSSDLLNLTDGQSMFWNCTGLTSFYGALSNLTNSSEMFASCTNLTSFSGTLPNLTNGTYMFGSVTSNCTKLDLTSVQNIANTINDLTAVGTTGAIHIGISSSIQDTPELEEALAAIVAKGWAVHEIYA